MSPSTVRFIHLNSYLTEHTVGNTVRKILHHIREEYKNASKAYGRKTEKADLSISNFILQGQIRKQPATQKSEAAITLKEDDPDDPDSFARALKPVLMEAIQDVLDELETVYDTISKSAKDHIHSEYAIEYLGVED
jgi:translation initiation factor eIF-2B subunit beta